VDGVHTTDVHSAAVGAIGAGRVEEGREQLRELVAGALDVEHLNDLAVASQLTGRLDDAETLLRAARVLVGEHRDIDENLELLAELRAGRVRAWRAEPGVGGTDSRMWERAFPGMPNHGTMGEHCVRYAFAMSRLGGLDVLDLGCGTGYGSEMLTWSASRVRGFDLWQPEPDQHPTWPGGAELNYGHDLCRDPLPRAEAATMFEVIEHLPDAPAALRLAWGAAGTLVASFPNPVHHGSHMNQWHVNDWTLEEFEQELRRAGGRCFAAVELEHFHQPLGSVLLHPGRDPEASFWVVVARGRDRRR
jgi:SAM-dependent methyltransferase